MSNAEKKSGRTEDTGSGGTNQDMEAMLAEMAEAAGVSWRPGDDISKLLKALEDKSLGPDALPGAVQEALGLVADAAEALEHELATGRDDTA